MMLIFTFDLIGEIDNPGKAVRGPQQPPGGDDHQPPPSDWGTPIRAGDVSFEDAPTTPRHQP